jgi:hypothetical protein
MVSVLKFGLIRDLFMGIQSNIYDQRRSCG